MKVLKTALPLLFFFTGACASMNPPTQQLTETETVIRQADQIGAVDYAPLEIRQARQKLEQARVAYNNEDYEKAARLAEQAKVDAELARFLDEYPERNVMIEGFTDSVGSEEYNQNLSLRRANSVQRALINQGISSNRIGTVGCGVRYPVATNQSESGRQQNCRVEVIISDQSGSIPERRN